MTLSVYKFLNTTPNRKYFVMHQPYNSPGDNVEKLTPESNGSNNLGYYNNNENWYVHKQFCYYRIYYIFSLFNCERKAERYKELPRKPESCVLNSPIIIKLYEFGEDCSSVQIL